MKLIKQFIREEEGAEIAEYALLVVILALALLTAAPNFQMALEHAYGSTAAKVDSNATTLGG
jgi:Flp pilus assembly pilin Flp